MLQFCGLHDSRKAGRWTRIARELLVSLDETHDPGATDAWLEEIDRRAAEVTGGTAELHDWETVRAQLRERWRH